MLQDNIPKKHMKLSVQNLFSLCMTVLFGFSSFSIAWQKIVKVGHNSHNLNRLGFAAKAKKFMTL